MEEVEAREGEQVEKQENENEKENNEVNEKEEGEEHEKDDKEQENEEKVSMKENDDKNEDKDEETDEDERKEKSKEKGKEKERLSERLSEENGNGSISDKEQDLENVYVAIANHAASKVDDLSFLIGDEITLIKKEKDDLWQGSIFGSTGYFNPKCVRPKTQEDVTQNKEAKKRSRLSVSAKNQDDFRKMTQEREKQHIKGFYPGLVIPEECIEFEDEEKEKWTFKNLDKAPTSPLIVFLNPKSGGNRGSILMKAFQRVLNPVQIFDITDGGPVKGLKKFSPFFSQFRVLACGGDGTVAWVLSGIDELKIHDKCAISILPLGTGNDLARVFGWGSGYDGENVQKFLTKIENSEQKKMDRWEVTIIDEEGKETKKSMNNYFSIGMGAKLAYDFGVWRGQNEKLFSSRTINKAAYAYDGFLDSIVRSCKDLNKKLAVTNNETTVTLPKCEEIILLNIPSYGGGINIWGSDKKKDSQFDKCSFDDETLEILSVEGSFHMGTIKMGVRTANRVCQGNNLSIKCLEKTRLPLQIDGEASMEIFQEIKVTHLNQVLMLYCKSTPKTFLDIFKKK